MRKKANRRDSSRNSLTNLREYRSGVDLVSQPSLQRRGSLFKRLRYGLNLSPRLRRRLLVGVSAAVVGVVIWSGWLAHTSVRIEATNDASRLEVTTQDVEAATISYFGRQRWQQHAASLQSDEFSKHLMKAIPQIESVSVARDWRERRLNLVVVPRSRAILWRQADKTYVVDSSGVAYRLATLQEVAGAIVVTDSSRLSITLGAAVAAPTTVRYIEQLVDQHSRYGVGDISGFIVGDQPRYLRIQLRSVDYEVRAVITDQGPSRMLTDWQEAHTYLKHQGRLPSQYLDLRVEGRAVYR